MLNDLAAVSERFVALAAPCSCSTPRATRSHPLPWIWMDEPTTGDRAVSGTEPPPQGGPAAYSFQDEEEESAREKITESSCVSGVVLGRES